MPERVRARLLLTVGAALIAGILLIGVALVVTWHPENRSPRKPTGAEYAPTPTPVETFAPTVEPSTAVTTATRSPTASPTKSPTKRATPAPPTKKATTIP